MIKAFNDYNSTQTAGTFEKFPQLPAGGYEAEIKNVSVVKSHDGSKRLEVIVDITEGEFKHHDRQGGKTA